MAHRPRAHDHRLRHRRHWLSAHRGAVRRVRRKDRHRLQPSGEEPRRLPRPLGLGRRRLGVVLRLFALARLPRRREAPVDRFRLDVGRKAQRPCGPRVGRPDAPRRDEAADGRRRRRAPGRPQGAARILGQDADQPAGIRHEFRLSAGVARRGPDDHRARPPSFERRPAALEPVRHRPALGQRGADSLRSSPSAFS